MAVLRIVLALVMTLARLLPFLLVAVLVFFLWRRSVQRQKDPDFRGPVITVDYEAVEDGEES